MSGHMGLLKEVQSRTNTHDCPECKKPTYCAMEAGKSANLCWCMTLPPLGKIPEPSDLCKCKDCLEKD